MEAGGGEGDHHVTHAYPPWVGNGLALGDAHHRPHQIDRPFTVDAGHLGGLAPEQNRPHPLAGPRDPEHRLGVSVGFEPGGGQVVEEEKRFGPDGEEVVGRVVHQVLAQGVEAADALGDQGFGAHAVGGGGQDRVMHAGEAFGVEQAAKGPDPGQDLFGMRGQNGRLDGLNKGLARLEAYPCAFVVHDFPPPVTPISRR